VNRVVKEHGTTNRQVGTVEAFTVSAMVVSVLKM